MRIISGKLKGKSINFLKNSTTRPLKDSVKENIFNILKHSNLINTKIEGKNILDLYSGIGSFGLECLSRNASSVTFIENYKEVLPVLKKNVARITSVHDMITELYPQKKSSQKNVTDHKKKTLSRVDHIISVSENTKRDLIKLFDIEKSKISVSHHGIDFSLF